MIKKLLAFLPILAVLVAIVFILHPVKALAFNANNLIDDGVFDNANSMSAAAIDSWINQFPSSCISTNSGFRAPLPTGYSPSGPVATGGFSYGADATAGAIIYAAAQAYGLNPQVILATLQKEQSLVTGDAGCSVLRYVGAMGNGCPDGGSSYNYSGFELYSINGVAVTSVNGTCVGPNNYGHPSSVGFSRQVITATWKLKFWEQRSKGNVNWNVQIPPNWDNSDDPPSCHAYLMTQGYRARSTSTTTCAGAPGNQVNYYDGYTTIDSTSVYLTNGATAALYIYTPHFAGNQNFDTVFQNWFGSLYDIYTWSLVSQYAYTDNTKTTPVNLANLTVGQKIYVGFQAKNTGTSTWSNSGSNPVHVGTTGPQDRVSGFCDTITSPVWMGCSRPANMIEASVAPNATGTFEFWYKAPTQPGTYDEHFSLLAENLKWMNDIGLYFHTITKPPTWSLVSQYAYTDNTKTASQNLSDLIPGQRVFIGFLATNTSGLTWSNSGSNPVRAGTTSPNDRASSFYDTTWPGFNRPAAMNEASVAPNATGTFEFWYKAPSTVGTFREHFKPVIEGLSWTNDTGMNFYTVVHFDRSGTSPTLGTNQLLSTGQSTVSSNGNYRLIMQGDGNLVLYSINRALWSSGTAGKPATKAVMQGDGNLVVYDGQDKPYWASGTAGKGTSSLIMQSDGNLVIYNSSGQPTWDSRTNGKF